MSDTENGPTGETTALATLERSNELQEDGGLAALLEETTVNLLLDCSYSMNAAQFNTPGEYRYRSSQQASKMAAMHEVASAISSRAAIRLILFGGNMATRSQNSEDILKAGAKFSDTIPARGSGTTPLHMGMELAAESGMERIIVVSDGYPDRPDTAMVMKAKFKEIQTFFIGDDTIDTEGVNFLRNLSSDGQVTLNDLRTEVGRRLLANRVIGLLKGADMSL